MAGRRRGRWLWAFEENMKAVLGPAQLSPIDGQAPRAQHRTEGVSGEWVVRRDANGVAYLVAPPPSGSSGS